MEQSPWYVTLRENLRVYLLYCTIFKLKKNSTFMTLKLGRMRNFYGFSPNVKDHIWRDCGT